MSDDPVAPEQGEEMADEDWCPAASPWLIAIGLMLAAFMELLDTSIVNVALPHIAGSLSASTTESTWVLTSYLIANAIVLPASAWFGRLFGRKRFLMTCMVLFTGASALCGVAQSLSFMVVARVLQGLAGGALQPIAQAVLLESFPPRRHGIAMALFGVGVVTAPVIGPTLGGWLADSYSWRWSFYINLPVGLVALIMTQAFMEDPPYLRRQARPQIDYLGFALMAVALGTLQLVLDKGQEDDWFEATWICVTSGVCVLSFVAFIIRELRVQHPIIDLRVLRDRTFAVGTFMMAAIGVVLYSVTVMLPLFLQTLVNYPALQSGLALSPRGLGSITAMLTAGLLVAHVDARILIGLGILLLVQSCFDLGQFTLQVSTAAVIPPTILNGFAIGMIFVPLTAIAMAKLPKEELGNATGIFNLMRNIGGSVGIALLATFLARDAQRHQALLIGNLTPFNPVYQQWLSNAQAALAARGATHPAEQALAVIYGTLLQQCSFAAFIDSFRLLAWFSLACFPTVFFFRHVRESSRPTVVH
jgi:DHA2 family multidrug resistance protein